MPQSPFRRSGSPSASKKNLFRIDSFGTLPSIVVPSVGARQVADTPHALVATGFVPAGTLEAGARIEFDARGTLLAGGPDPRLIADWTIGPVAAPTVLRPIGGTTVPGYQGVPIDNRGVEVSYQTVGPNGLAKVDGELVHWRIDLDLLLTAARLRGTGSVRWSAFATETDEQSAMNQAAAFELMRSYTAGTVVARFGILWHSVAGMAAAENTPTTAPGDGRDSPLFWTALTGTMPFAIDETFDKSNRSMALTFRMGGPVQMDVNADPPSWEDPLNPGSVNPALPPTLNASGLGGLPELDGSVSHAQSSYVAAVQHRRSDGLFPSVPPTSVSGRRFWRRLADERGDRLVVDHCEANLFSLGDTIRVR